MNAEVTMEDGKLVINGLRISPYFQNFEDISLPDEFIAFFLNPQTKEDVVRLIRKVAETYPKIFFAYPDRESDGRKLVFDAVAKGGLSAGWKMLDSLQTAKPNGKPQFYRSLSSRTKDESFIVLTDGTDAFKFSTTLNIESLPPNVYCKEENVWLTLNKELFDLAKQQTDDFFKFTKKIVEMHELSYRVNIGETLKAFLINRELADKMVADAELWINFLRAALKCPQGYLVYKDVSRRWERGYLITHTGEVYVFSRKGQDSLVETVMLAVKQGVPITNLRKERLTDDERVRLSKAVGSVNATMPLLLLP